MQLALFSTHEWPFPKSFFITQAFPISFLQCDAFSILTLLHELPIYEMELWSSPIDDAILELPLSFINALPIFLHAFPL